MRPFHRTCEKSNAKDLRFPVLGIYWSFDTRTATSLPLPSVKLNDRFSLLFWNPSKQFEFASFWARKPVKKIKVKETQSQ